MSASVFPARAGMSRRRMPPGSGGTGVPRASGDEPVEMMRRLNRPECSPRERG